MNSSIIEKEDQVKYSKLLSSFFCSAAIVTLTFLCLLNDMAFDFYSTLFIAKVVAPASFCFWIIGRTIGNILDGLSKTIVQKKIVEEKQAYEMPSIFGAESAYTENNEDIGVL